MFFSSAGLYTDNEKCYHRVIDIRDATAFAQVLYAAVEQKAKAESSSLKLHDFLIENDIEKWSTSFLDPGWTHEVIHVRSIKAFREFFNLMQDVRTIRRQIVSRVLKVQRLVSTKAADKQKYFLPSTIISSFCVNSLSKRISWFC